MSISCHVSNNLLNNIKTFFNFHFFSTISVTLQLSSYLNKISLVNHNANNKNSLEKVANDSLPQTLFKLYHINRYIKPKECKDLSVYIHFKLSFIDEFYVGAVSISY